MLNRLKEHRKRIAVLFSIGLVISLLLRRNLISADIMFLSDMFFIISMVFIISALWELVSNMGLFNSMVFGAKCLYRIFRRNISPSSQVKDEYIEYVNSRQKYSGVSTLLLIGIGFLGISVIPILFGNKFFSAIQF